MLQRSRAIAGLVAITPGSGFVGSSAAVTYGFLADTICNFSTQLKFIFGYGGCVFTSHTFGGIVGNICTALFAQSSFAGFDGATVIPGGWFDHHCVQLGYQHADSTAGFGHSFDMTSIILWILHFGMRLRCEEETEILDVDDAELGEFAYVGLDAELGAGLPHTGSGPGGLGADIHVLGAVSGGREPQHEQHFSAKRGCGEGCYVKWWPPDSLV